MAVSIPISASAGGAVDAIRQIQQAIERAGQAGVEFAKLDLSHPELAGFAEDLRKISGRLQDLGRIGRGANPTAYRAIQNAAGGAYSDPLSWAAGVDRAFPDPQQAARHRAAVMNYATQGTRWAAPPPAGIAGGGGTGPGAPGPAGFSPAAGGGGPNYVTPTPGGGLLGGGLAGVLGKGLIGFSIAKLAINAGEAIEKTLTDSYNKAKEEATENDKLLRHMADGVTDFNALRDAVRDSTKGLGLNYQEAQRLSLAWAKLTGDNRPETVSAGVRFGVGMARTFGMDAGTATGSLAQATSLGIDPRNFATLIGEAVVKSGRSADEITPAVVRLADAAAKTLVTHSNALEAGGMLAGLNATMLPGFKGAHAEDVMNTLSNSLSKGGNAGPASAAFSYAAMARNGVTDRYDQQYLLEGGLFATPQSELGYGSKTSVLQMQMEEMRRRYPGTSLHDQIVRANAAENHTGLNERQYMALDLKYKPADLTPTFSALNNADVNIKTMNPTAIADAMAISNADAEALQKKRQQLIDRTGDYSLSADEREKLRAAGPGDLRNMMLRLVATHGQDSNQGTDIRNVEANISNAESYLGRSLIAPANALGDGAALLIRGAGLLLNAFGQGSGMAQDYVTRHIGDAMASIGDRNNNPLNLKDIGGQFRAFATPEGGISAAYGQLMKYQSRGLTTLRQMISRWAPPSENDTNSYIAEVARQTGLDPDQSVNMSDPLTASRVVAAMGKHEVGHPLDPQMVARGVKAATAGAPATAASHPGIMRIEPLEVIHKDQTGLILGNQSLPVTDISPPIPSGTYRPGERPDPPHAPYALRKPTSYSIHY